MDKQEKIKIAITAGISSVILLILVLFLAFSGKGGNDGKKLEENIASYSDSTGEEADSAQDAITASSGAEETDKDKAQGVEAKDNGNEEIYKEASLDNSNASQSSEKALAKSAVSGNSFYSTDVAVLKDVYKGMKYDVNAQLKEMYTYWADGNTAAVRDLAHLDRFEVMSFSLTGTSDFYYYGDKNSDGKPEGLGLALYANDQYYFGHWSGGVRSGDGTWISFYPSYSTNVVAEHMYTGQWAGDLPDGSGQEHYDYNSRYMNDADIYIQNAIGGFSSGKYNGEMYIITIDKDGNTQEWTGNCDKGDFEQIPYAAVDKLGKIPVLNGREDSENHIYMTKDGAKNHGVKGIITGGKQKD